MKNYNWRYRTFLWIKRHIWTLPEGVSMPWPLMVVRFLLMPINTSYYLLNRKIEPYDFNCETYTINGIKFSSQFFECFMKQNIGKTFKIVSLENGLITVKPDGL